MASRLDQLLDFVRRASLKARRDSLSRLGLRVRENYHLDSPVLTPREDVRRIAVLSKALQYTRPSALDADDLVTYSFPKRYVYELPEATIDLRSGLVYDRDGKLVAESSSWPIVRLLCEVPRPFIRPPSRVQPGRHVFMATTPNMYHWLLEDLPPFLKASELAPNATAIAAPTSFRPIEEFVETLADRPFLRATGRVRVESLVMGAKTSGMGTPFSHNALHPVDVQTVRHWFDEKLSFSNKQAERRIYTSRSRWRRSIEGEEQLERALEAIGFEIFHGDIGLVEQVELFSSARCIVGPTGAAMTNMLWLPPKAHAILLNKPRERFHFYFDMAHMLGLDIQHADMPTESWTPDSIADLVETIEQALE